LARTGVSSRGWNFPKNLGNEPSTPAIAWTRSEPIIQAAPWCSRQKTNRIATIFSSTWWAPP